MSAGLGPEGTRVNAISAGPIKTLAAAGIKSFRKMLEHNAKQTPLRRNVKIEEVGNAAAFLCSDLALALLAKYCMSMVGLIQPLWVLLMIHENHCFRRLARDCFEYRNFHVGMSYKPENRCFPYRL